MGKNELLRLLSCSWYGYLRQRGHRLSKQDSPQIWTSLNTGNKAYRWVLFATASRIKRLDVQEKKFIRFNISKARENSEQCYLVAGFATEEPRIVILPADKAVKDGRVASDTGGIDWVELENSRGGDE